MNVFDGLDLATMILLVFAALVLAALAVVGAIETAFWIVHQRRRSRGYSPRHR